MSGKTSKKSDMESLNQIQKTKLLFITYTHSAGGGAEKILTTLVNNLDCSRYEIGIQEICGFHIKQEPINDNILLFKPLIDFNNETLFSKHFTQYCIEKYPALIRAVKDWERYDVIITWNYQLPSFLLPAFQDKKIIAWFHTDIYDLQPQRMSRCDIYNFKLQYTAWNFADKIITISKKSFSSLQELFPEYSSKADIIYNPIDLSIVNQRAKEMIDGSIINQQFPTIVCVGYIDKRKNFLLVIKAVEKLRKNNLRCNLIILGDGPQKKDLMRISALLNISDCVLLLGYQHNPIPYIRYADILCVSSLAEGFPTVVCEAMCLGKPFVTTPVAGASEELADGERCGLVADWDCDDYAEKIKRLLTDKALYNEMSKNCIERIKEFSVERSIERFENLLTVLPEKRQNNLQVVDKQIAIKKIRRLYIWSFDFALQRLQFSINSFFTRGTIKHFMLMGYYMFRFIFYILTVPVRLFVPPVLLKEDWEKKCQKS